MPECMNIENGGQMITQKPTQIKWKKNDCEAKKGKKAILLQRFGASHTLCVSYTYYWSMLCIWEKSQMFYGLQTRA